MPLTRTGRCFVDTFVLLSSRLPTARWSAPNRRRCRSNRRQLLFNRRRLPSNGPRLPSSTVELCTGIRSCRLESPIFLSIVINPLPLTGTHAHPLVEPPRPEHCTVSRSLSLQDCPLALWAFGARPLLTTQHWRGGGGHPATFSTAPTHQTTGLRNRGNDTSKSTGRSGRQNAATRRNMRREERATVQGPVKEQQRDGMSHGGGGGGWTPNPRPAPTAFFNPRTTQCGT